MGGIEIGVTGSDIGDEAFLLGFTELMETRVDTVHVRIRMPTGALGCKGIVGDGSVALALGRGRRGSSGNEAEAFEGEEGVDGGDLGKASGHELGVAAGSDDGQGFGFEFGFDFADELADEAAVAVDSSDEHGGAGAFADDLAGLADLDSGEEGGFFVEIIGHGGETGGDDAADVILVAIDDIESDRGTEIDHQRWGSEVMGDGDGVSEAIGADGFGLGIGDADSNEVGMIQFDTVELKGIERPLTDQVGGVGHDTAPGDGGGAGGAEPALDGGGGLSIAPVGGWDIDMARDPFG